MQVGMMATLLVAMASTSSASSSLFTAIIFLHNAFAATMDVAIDALAVSVLPDDERGTANGFMFAGATIGQAIGGSLVLFLTAVMPFQSTYLFVVAAILAITLFVVLPLRETARAPLSESARAARNVYRELVGFVRDAWRAFTGSRAALVGVLFAVLPAGAYALSLGLQSNLGVELGLNDSEVAELQLYATVIFAPSCILGGWLSDRFGRRSTLALFIFLTVVPTLWLAWTMWQAGWIMPVDIKMANRPTPSRLLIVTFWATTIVYNIFQGLYYGIRSALFMDITTPAVAATQFTAYMALMNLCTSYTAAWQGYRGRADRLPGDVDRRLAGRRDRARAAAADAAGARRGAGGERCRHGCGRLAPGSGGRHGAMSATDPAIDLAAWRGRSETRSDAITAAPLAALAATLDRDDPAPVPGSAVPPLWHWLYFLPMRAPERARRRTAIRAAAASCRRSRCRAGCGPAGGSRSARRCASATSATRRSLIADVAQQERRARGRSSSSPCGTRSRPTAAAS